MSVSKYCAGRITPRKPTSSSLLSVARECIFCPEKHSFVRASLNDPPRMRLFVTAADVSTGENLRAYFQARASATDGATAGGAGELAFFETPIDPSAAFATLREMLNEAVKP